MTKSDLPDFNPEQFGCGEITRDVEEFVENNWEECKPLDDVFGITTYTVIKTIIKTVKEETQRAGLKLMDSIAKGEYQTLIQTCTSISYWCCCEALKKVSPIIAKATNNLIY